MACIGNNKHACYRSCVEARRDRAGLFLLELFVLLVVVLSQILQLFMSPSVALLAVGTIPCTLLWKRPLVAFLLVCISITIYLISGDSFFRILARETTKGNKRKKSHKGTKPNAKHLYAPQGVIVSLVGEGLDDAGAEACARKELGGEDLNIASNPELDEKIYYTRDGGAPHEQVHMGRCYFKKKGDVFSRRNSNNTQNLYCIRGDTRSGIDIDREIQVAGSRMEEMLSAFPDT